MKKHLFGFGKAPKSRGRFEAPPYDPEKEYPVIRASICTGERVAGFRDRHSGSFKEVMLIRTPEDEREFKETYGVEDLKTEY